MSGLDLPRVIGHRGAAGSAPENTLAGFRHAAELGVGWVELDVQLTSDGVPVVFHDDGLERTTNGQGSLVETSLSELRRLDAGAWFGPAFAGELVPTLAEAVALIAELGLGLNIEVKADEARGAETARAALEVARAAWPAKSQAPLISSFARSALAAALELAPEWPRGLLVGALPEDWRETAKGLRCASLNVDHRRLNPSKVTEIKAAKLKVLAYTVNSPVQAQRLWDWGVSSVFCDRPERVMPLAPLSV